MKQIKSQITKFYYSFGLFGGILLFPAVCKQKGILLCHQILAAFRLTCYFKSNISYWFASILSLTFYIFSQKMEENRKGTRGQNRSESNSNVVLKNYIVKNQQEIHQRPKTFSSKTVSQ